MNTSHNIDKRYLIAIGLGIVLVITTLFTASTKDSTGEYRSKAAEPIQQKELIPPDPTSTIQNDTTMTDDQGHDLDLSHYSAY
jgi:hypothetical protein